MRPKGIYRTATPLTGAEYAFVDYGSCIGELPKGGYEERGYQPPFDRLPTKEDYEVTTAGKQDLHDPRARVTPVGEKLQNR